MLKDIAPIARRYRLYQHDGAFVAEVNGLADALCDATTDDPARNALADLRTRGKPATADDKFPDVGDLTLRHPHLCRRDESAVTDSHVVRRVL